MSVVFEGSEKKLELVVREGISLLKWPEERFFELVKAAGTQILSKIENDECRAYLLSESSLFVRDDRFTMITCGKTALVNAALKAIEYIKPSKEDTTLEILMYGLQGKAREVFNDNGQTVESIREITGGHKIFEGFVVDDHVFNPVGYWSFSFVPKGPHPLRDFSAERVKLSGLTFQYYNENIHIGAYLKD